MHTKIRLKLQGLEIEIEGDRAEVPLIAANMGQQFAQILEPAANMAQGVAPRKSVPNTVLPSSQIEEKVSAGRSRARRGKTSSTAAATPIEFTHNEPEFGKPSQQWNPTEKSVWLLHVIHSVTGRDALSAAEIAATFNAYFKRARTIRGSNVSRDLKKVASGKDALVVLDAATDKWSLSTEGVKVAAKLVEDSKLAAGAA